MDRQMGALCIRLTLLGKLLVRQEEELFYLISKSEEKMFMARRQSQTSSTILCQ
jgi:hypothetical protein